MDNKAREVMKIKIEDDPLEYQCPITMEIMEDPVIMPDGYTYERKEIMALAKPNGNSTLIIISPMTRQEMSPDSALPNRAIKDAIERHKAKSSNSVLSSNTVMTSPQLAAQPLPSAVSYTHEALMTKLAECCRCDAQQVDKIHVWTAQTMIALAGIYTAQDGAALNRAPDSVNTRMTFKFASTHQYHRFLMHYRNTYQGSIIDPGKYEEDTHKAIVTISSQILYEQLAPTMEEYALLSHQKLLEELATQLKVEYTAVHSGDAVERRLVSLAGIDTSQKNAMFRRNTDYTTRFHLAFGSLAEYQKFVDYYQQHYPFFLINMEGYQPGFSIIHVNTKLLINTVAPNLTESLDSKCCMM